MENWAKRNGFEFATNKSKLHICRCRECQKRGQKLVLVFKNNIELYNKIQEIGKLKLITCEIICKYEKIMLHTIENVIEYAVNDHDVDTT